MNEQEAIERAAQGDKTAFGKLFDWRQRFVYNVAYRMLGDSDAAEDVAQEVFLAVWRSLPQFRGESRFSTWLYRITVNRTLNRIKQEKKVTPLRNEERLVANGEAPGESVEREQAKEELNVLLAKIAPERRLVIVLREIEGLSYEEIAATINLPVGTVRSRLNRGRKELEKVAGEELKDET